MTNEKPWTVNLWGSHPDADNDDCWTGDDYASEAEAREVFSAADPVAAMAATLPEPQRAAFLRHYRDDTTHVELDGPNANGVREVPAAQKRPVDWREWTSEVATQAGMVGGCDARNEVLGC